MGTSYTDPLLHNGGLATSSPALVCSHKIRLSVVCRSHSLSASEPLRPTTQLSSHLCEGRSFSVRHPHPPFCFSSTFLAERLPQCGRWTLGKRGTPILIFLLLHTAMRAERKCDPGTEARQDPRTCRSRQTTLTQFSSSVSNTCCLLPCTFTQQAK